MKKLTGLIGPLVLLVLMTVPAFAALGAIASLSGSPAVARLALGGAQNAQPGAAPSGQIQGPCLTAGAGRGQANRECKVHPGSARPTPALRTEPTGSSHGQSGIDRGKKHAAAAETGANQQGRRLGKHGSA